MPREPMTLDRLAGALRDTSRDSVILIDTPDGPKPLRSVRSAYGYRGADGAVIPLPSGSTASDKFYIIVVSADPP
jgi:hypothetical protein